MAILSKGRLLGILCAAAVMLAGCANNMENAAQILAERPQRTCQVPIEGDIVTFSGEDCTQIAASYRRSQALNACAGMASDNEGMCVMAVALGGQQGQQSRQSDDTRLLVTAMQSDTQITSAWINQIPLVGTVANGYFNYKSTQQLHDTLRTAFDNSGPSIGRMSITKSDDGGLGGEGGSGRGGDGDQFVVLGNDNGVIPGDGSVVSDGRNAAIIGPGQHESTFDPATTFNNEVEGKKNPTGNQPFIDTNDNDGSGDNSIVPGL